MKAFVAAVCLGASWSIAAWAAVPVTPAAVRRQVASEGAKEAVEQLDASGDFDRVLDAIGRGSTRWVAVAPLLAGGTDASNTMGLRVAMARALPINPVAVLRYALEEGSGNDITVSLVCEIPFIEPTAAFVAAYKRHVLAALDAVHAKGLADRKAACLKSLNSP